jgi:hypothetical protein
MNINGKISTAVYKADTIDFDLWFGYQQIIINGKDNLVVNNCLEPFVSFKDNMYEMYVSVFNGENYIIKCYSSNDGINFN